MSEPQLFSGQAGLPVSNPSKSYWLKEPSEKLLGHRTTPELPASADVVIVGSGITAAFAAHTLKERKPELNVVMLEAREACFGATGRVGSLFSLLFGDSEDGQELTKNIEWRSLPAGHVRGAATYCFIRASNILVLEVYRRGILYPM